GVSRDAAPQDADPYGDAPGDGRADRAGFSISGLPGDGAAPPRKKTVEVPPAVYEDYRTVSASWKDIVAGEGRLFSSVFRHSTVSAGEEGIEILFGDPYYMRLAENREKTRTVASILEARFGKQFKVRLRLLPAGDAAPEVVSGKRIPGIDMDIEEE
ncbi:MAG: hypothetical protein J6U26_02500, partial [Lachnospiraceae bacterium]|nr:hypothetical protein [Lachnospiraceae bacterium]